MSETRQHLEALFGDTAGWVFIAIGRGGHFNENGKYRHDDWKEESYSWPQQADEVIRVITEAASTADVYFTPGLSWNPQRQRFKNPKHARRPQPAAALWADLDHDWNRDRLAQLGDGVGLVSGSSDDRRHAYLPLVEPAPVETVEDLLARLAAWLGGDSSTWHGTYLRPAGTLNHKTNPPTPLRLLQWPEQPTWTVEDLDRLLPAARHKSGSATTAKPEALGEISAELADQLAEPAEVGTRSQRTYAVVALAAEHGYSDGQILTMMRQHKPTTEKYGNRADAQVRTVIGKVRAEMETDRLLFAAAQPGAQQNGQTIRAKPQAYFQKPDGLLAAKLADDIEAIGPLAYGIDDIMWSYTDGVWRPDRHVITHRVTQLLGNRYRRNHSGNVEDIIRARSRKVTCEPVSEVINFRNGLYLWQADQLRPHDPDVLTTVQLSVDWDPDAKCPAFDTFLSQVVPKDAIGLVWEAIGYLLYSGNPLHRAYMLVGGGRNGKGTLLRTLGTLIGAANYTAVSLQSLVTTRFSTANLFGKIANIAGDIDGTYLESTAMFKAITGQDQITAEHKGRDAFDFTPWAVPVFSANKVPPSADVTTGYLSRWLIIPFPNDFTGKEDRHLDARLQAKDELQGIAAKAIPALQKLMRRGDFDPPASVKQAQDEFARRVDQVRTWVNECCETGDLDTFTARTSLYRDYKAWTIRDGYKPVRSSEFYDRLDALPGCRPTRRGTGTRGYEGIKVTDTCPEVSL